ARTAEFVRPVHSVVLLLGSEVIPVEVLGLKSGNVTFGHRFHSPRPISLKSPGSYEGRLRGAKVLADFDARREAIREGVSAAASQAGGTALIDGKLTGGFVTVSNIQSRDPAQVRAGNERVVRPRLSDAAFFWQQDRRVSLEVHASHLSEVTFQAKLGSYAEKTRRVKRLALWIGERIGAGADVGRAAELCKADLMTAM